MQHKEEDDNQWIIVKKRKKKYIEKEYKQEKIKMKGGRAQINREFQVQMEEVFINDLNVKSNTQRIVHLCKQRGKKEVKIEVLGLGNFNKYLKPHLQWLLLKKILTGLSELSIQYTLNIFDPIFSQEEQSAVKQLNSSCHQLLHLEKQSHYLIYMPHCDRQLYEHIFSLNKEPNNSLIIIGNSIKEYIQRCQLLNTQLPEAFIGYSSAEQRIKDYRQAFNDTYIYQIGI